MERWIGILIEQYSGRMPLWLAPVQVVVAPITAAANDYAQAVVEAACDAGLRVELDDRNEKIGYKIREHSTAKVPVILAVGEREAEAGAVAMRRLGSKDQIVKSLAEAMAELSQEALAPDLRS